ncbi:two-component sensor histidine kinase [Cereibacter changlensis]|uniref:histidine kinase n=3 Tax=Cereibacter changlensis TaxID=402884 RepID=A0A2W7RZJ8_9RHOB|nr:histidine kinase dimerization/phosphoacceptor domain -containing protein [Cereibacter changlensis]PZX56315.1 two-component sensor histidine kinase [Cereibacter changlensis]
MQWSSKAFLVLRLGAMLFPLLGCLLWAFWSGSQQVRRMQQQGAENVQLIELYTDRLIQTQTVLKEAVRGHVEGQPAGYLRTAEFRDFLTGLQGAQAASQGLALLSADGAVLAASRGFSDTPPLALEDYRANLAADSEVFLDRSVGREAQDAFIIAMPLRLGETEAIFVSAIEVLSMRGFLQSIATTPGQAASLLREDGKLLMRNVPSRPILFDASSTAAQSIAEGDDGHYRTLAISDGVERLYAFTRVGNLPLFAMSGVPVADVRRMWLAQALPVWLFLGALSLFTFVLTARIRRSVSDGLRQRETHEQLAAARQLAEQRSQLLQELNHRVKNNLAVIGSLISFQVRLTGKVDPEALKARLQAVAEVHALLYRAQENDRIDLGQLLARLARSPAIVPPERGIHIGCEVEEGIMIGPDSAIPLALIVAELLTNAVKHAFPEGRPGSLSLRLTREGERATLDLADDGIGAPTATDRRSGLRILEGLLAQAEATLVRLEGQGTRYRLDFPVRAPTLPQLGRRAETP